MYCRPTGTGGKVNHISFWHASYATNLMNVVPQIKRGPKTKVGHVTYGTPFWLTFALFAVGLYACTINLHTKFEV